MATKREERVLEKIEERGRTERRAQTLLDKVEQRGRTEGQAQMLLEQLSARFGTVPARARARILAADGETLMRWGVRFVTATTLKDVLDDGAGQRRPAAKAAGRRR